MRKVRIAKKSQNLMRSFQSQSRQIIISIYVSIMDNESEKLQFSKDNNLWNKSIESVIIPQQTSLKDQQQPTTNLLPLLHNLKPFHIHSCSFILIDYNTIHVALQQEKLKILKDKKQKGQIRYWLSHIYFSKLRTQLAQQLLLHNKVEQRQIIHNSEQKEYMPTIIIGKKTSQSMVRKIIVSKESIYSKKGVKESQPFCLLFFVNGSQQTFSFTQILSFIQYPFNIEQISYLQIIVTRKQGVKPIITTYSNKHQTYQQMQRIQKMKRVLQRQQRWKFVQEQYEQLKSKTIKDQNYKAYGQFLSLQIISFLQVRQLVKVKELMLQWTIDKHNNFIISNCFVYKFASINQFLPGTQGLATLYAKKFVSLSNVSQIRTQKVAKISKRTKSEQRQNIGHFLSPLKPYRRSLKKSELFIKDLSNIREKNQTTLIKSIKSKINL